AGRASRGGPWSPAAGRGGAAFGTERGRHREHLDGGGQEPSFGAIRGRAGVTAMQSDYYLVLGVSRDETSRGIRHACRQPAKRHHPDLAGPEQAGAFRELVEAYEVLSDAEKRRRYTRGLRRAEGRLDVAPDTIVFSEEVPAEPLAPGPVSVRYGFRR